MFASVHPLRTCVHLETKCNGRRGTCASGWQWSIWCLMLGPRSLRGEELEITGTPVRGREAGHWC
jgi:hypothetical protein